MFDRSARNAFIMLCVALVVSSVGFRVAVEVLNVHLQKKPVKLRAHFDTISSSLGPWQAVGDAEILSVEMIEELGTDQYLSRTYVRSGEDGDEVIRLHLAYYTGLINAVPHVPDRCMAAAGFRIRKNPVNLNMPIDLEQWSLDPEHVNERTKEPYRVVHYRDRITKREELVRLPIGTYGLRTTEFSRDDLPDAKIFAGYCFIANGCNATTPNDVKTVAFRLSEQYAYYCKVQFVTMGDQTLTVEDFIAGSSDLLTHLLPEMMRCLPDWEEVEQRSAAGEDIE